MSIRPDYRMVHVVNRTTRWLQSMWDGTPYDIPPGYRLETREVAGEKVPVIDPETGEPQKHSNGKVVLEERPGRVEQVPVGAGPDGQPLQFMMPFYAAEAARRQNPVRGTLHPTYHRRYEMLIGVVEWENDISHIEQSTAPELLDRRLLPPDRQDVVQQYVPGTRGTPEERYRRGMYSDPDLGNPTGLKGEYPGGADFSR